MERGDVCWVDLAPPLGSEPGYRRPVVVVQSDAFNRSRIGTTIVVVLSGNMRLLDAPGNVLLTRGASGLPEDSVANVSQLVTLDRSTLEEHVGKVKEPDMARIDAGIRLVLDL